MLHAPVLSPRGHTSFISAPEEFYDCVLGLRKYSCMIGVMYQDLCVLEVGVSWQVGQTQCSHAQVLL